MDTGTTEYPIPTSDLRKGDIVSVDQIEEAFRVARGTDAYQLAARRASDYIVQRLAERGLHVTIAQRKHSLMILTDEEASTYNAHRFDLELGGAGRALRRLAEVDRSQLSSGRIVDHDRALEVRGRMLAAARRERRQLQPKPHERTTPGLPPSKDTP